MKNYYEELEVSRNASNEVISKAYKTLAKKYHPDSTKENKQTAEERFKRISEAYDTLSNEQKRAEYDRTLQPEIDSDKYNKMLEDNRRLSRELINLKNQLDNMNKTSRNVNTYTQNNYTQQKQAYTYNNSNQNNNTYTQPNYTQNNTYYQPRQTVYRKPISFIDELKYKFMELGKKIFAMILTFSILVITLGVLYLIPSTRNFLINDLHLGILFILFR